MDTCIDRVPRNSSVRVGAPMVAPVVVSELREYLKAYEEDDALITRLARRATAFCQRWQGRAYLAQQFADRFDRFPGGDGKIELRWGPGYYGPNNDCTVAYLATNSTLVTLSLTSGDFGYDFEAVRPVIFPSYGESWPATLTYPIAVRVQYWAGVGSAESVDEEVKQAIEMLVCHWFRNREAVLTGSISKEVEIGLKDLLGPRRIVPVG